MSGSARGGCGRACRDSDRRHVRALRQAVEEGPLGLQRDDASPLLHRDRRVREAREEEAVTAVLGHAWLLLILIPLTPLRRRKP